MHGFSKRFVESRRGSSKQKLMEIQGIEPWSFTNSISKNANVTRYHCARSPVLTTYPWTEF